MELNAKKFALAGGLAMAIVYVVCSAFVALFPAFSTQLVGWLIHADGLVFEMRVSAAGFVWGIFQSFVYAYLGLWLFTWLYNRLVAK